MGQFKPMVKMMTTEPSVELKLKKGGTVKKPAKMMDGGVMGGLAAAPSAVGARGGMSPVARPARPSMAARRAAMKGAPMGRPMMKEGGESKAEHAKEMKVAAEFKKHKGMPASKAHKGLNTGGVVMGQGGYKTGGVVMGQGGYKTGGVVNGQGGYKKGGKVKMAKGGMYCADGGIITEAEGSKDAGEYKDTKMVTTKGQGAISDSERKMMSASKKKSDSAYREHINPETGEMEIRKAGGYKKGGMPMKDGKPAFLSKKKGGAAKKYAKGGAVNDSGKAESMPQGHKTPSTPVSITKLSGTFKKGGAVMTPAEKRSTKVFNKENAPAMKAAKTNSNEVYSKYGKKMRSGGMC